MIKLRLTINLDEKLSRRCKTKRFPNTGIQTVAKDKLGSRTDLKKTWVQFANYSYIITFSFADFLLTC